MKPFSSQYLQKIRQQNPLVHNITNIVAANFSANGLLALGASPIMVDHLDEVAEVVAMSQSLVINIGTLATKQVNAMILAGKTANSLGVPVIFDPVGVGAIVYRQQLVAKLLTEIKVDLIRGNAGELAQLAGLSWQSKGVDAGSGVGNYEEIVQTVAKKYHCVAAMSGETDFISDGKRLARLNNGSPLFPKVTASGCLLSAICGAFLAVEKDVFSASVEACTAYAVAGECAAAGLSPTDVGQFAVNLLNQLSAITPDVINQMGKVSYE